ncbi:MAG: hypothetical protein M5U12_19535 [Verrucomicrobia bacterium]|nr:hypothetical protein [Verrucomicrobiota bacterium]
MAGIAGSVVAEEEHRGARGLGWKDEDGVVERFVIAAQPQAIGPGTGGRQGQDDQAVLPGRDVEGERFAEVIRGVTGPAEGELFDTGVGFVGDADAQGGLGSRGSISGFGGEVEPGVAGGEGREGFEDDFDALGPFVAWSRWSRLPDWKSLITMT